jgi:hypothetical protein
MKFQKTITIADLDKFDYSTIQRGQWIRHGQDVYGQFLGLTKSKTVVILHKREYSKNYMSKWNENLKRLKEFANQNKGK